MLNLATLLTSSTRRDPDKVALTLGPLTTSYAELDDLASRVATLLHARGIQPGDTVAIQLPNVPEFAIVYYGALKAGAVVLPLNPLLKKGEIAYHLKDAGAKILFATVVFQAESEPGAADAGVEYVPVPLPAGDTDVPRLTDLAREHEPLPALTLRSPVDPAVLIYTSGTTGTPKGATLSHDNLLWNAFLASRQIVQMEPTDVVVGALPLFHSFGQSVGLNAALLSGATLALLPRFDAEGSLDLIEQQSATVFLGVPTMYTAMLHAESADRRDLSKLRLCVSGGAAIPVEVIRAFEAKFAARILEGYGLSETSPIASFNHQDRPSKPGSIGTPVWGVEFRLRDDDGNEPALGDPGEIQIRGHNVMLGYHGKPEATAAVIDAEGWFSTGDVATVDDDGYYFIVDRKKDMIIRGGYNVYPREIEEVLHEHPAVAEAAVLGVPHESLGEEVGAAVVLKPGASATPEEIRAFAKERVAAYKYPRIVQIIDELPKGATGKILKREISLQPSD